MGATQFQVMSLLDLFTNMGSANVAFYSCNGLTISCADVATLGVSCNHCYINILVNFYRIFYSMNGGTFFPHALQEMLYNV